MANKSVLKPTIQVTLFSLVTIVLGFANQLVLAYYFGASSERDAYFASSAIPMYISSIFAGSIGAIFLSHYINVNTNKSGYAATRFLNSLVTCCFSILFVITLVGFLFSSSIVKLSAPGFKINQILLSSEILKILLPTIILQGLIYILTAVYQSNHDFILPAFAAICNPLLTLGFVLITHTSLGIKSIAWGTLISNSLSLFILFLFLIRDKKFGFTWVFNNEDVKGLMVSAFPLFLAGLVFRFTSVWERLMASKLPNGSVSYLGYANQILVIMTTITTGGISTIFFPILSRAWSEANMETLRLYFQKGIRLILFVTLPIASLFVIVKIQLIQLFFERGAFDHYSTIAVSNCITFMLGAFVFQSLGSIVVRAFYFMNLTVKLSIIGTIEIVFYIILSILFCKIYSYSGLAIALSLSSMINLILSSILINNKIKIFDYNFSLDAVKILICSVLPTIVIVFLRHLIRLENLFTTSICYFLMYILILSCFNFEEIKILKNKLLCLSEKKNGNRKSY